MITQQCLRSILLYDQELGILYWRSPTGKRVREGQIAGSLGHNGRYVIGINNKNYLQSRVIWLYVHGELPTGDIDHIDGDPKNNRIENLRDVPHCTNMKNMPIRKDNKSGCIGVCWDRSRGRWRVQIDLDGEKKTLGRFNSLAMAVSIRKLAEIDAQYHCNHGRENPLITKLELKRLA